MQRHSPLKDIRPRHQRQLISHAKFDEDDDDGDGDGESGGDD